MPCCTRIQNSGDASCMIFTTWNPRQLVVRLHATLHMMLSLPASEEQCRSNTSHGSASLAERTHAPRLPGTLGPRRIIMMHTHAQVTQPRCRRPP